MAELFGVCVDGICKGHNQITLYLPGHTRRKTRRLFGKSGPCGKVISQIGDKCHPESLVAFEMTKVMSYIYLQGWIKIDAISKQEVRDRLEQKG